jgi:hypothetical protein
MTTVLERRYRRLLLAYPRAYRRELGDELLGTLMELSRPGQRWPAPRQAAALLLAGTRMRTGADRLASPAHAWRDSARALLVLMLTLHVILQIWMVQLTRADLAQAGDTISWQQTGGAATTTVVAAAAVLALLVARNRLGVALALLAPLPPLLPPFTHTFDTLYVFQMACWWLPVTGVAVLLLRRPSPSRGWRRSLIIPMLALAAIGLVAPTTALAMVIVCLLWAAVIDPRPALAFGLLLLTAIPQLAVSVSALVLVVPFFLVVGSALVGAGALRAHRIPA